MDQKLVLQNVDFLKTLLQNEQMTFPKLFILFFFLFLSAPVWSATVACVTGKKSALPQYSPVRVTGKTQNGRFEVQDFNGASALISRKDLTYGIKCVTVSVGKSRLRQGPGKDFKAAALAERGQTYLDLGGEDGWTLVQDQKGEKAWIDLDHLWSPTAGKVRMSFDVDR